MFELMSAWKNIRLELSRTAGFPFGSVSRAYLLKLPLDDEDRVDRDAVRLEPDRATVRRHWASEPDQRGKIQPADDEFELVCEGVPKRVLKLDGQAVRLGQQLSIVDDEGRALPFLITSIR